MSDSLHKCIMHYSVAWYDTRIHFCIGWFNGKSSGLLITQFTLNIVRYQLAFASFYRIFYQKKRDLRTFDLISGTDWALVATDLENPIFAHTRTQFNATNESFHVKRPINLHLMIKRQKKKLFVVLKHTYWLHRWTSGIGKLSYCIYHIHLKWHNWSHLTECGCLSFRRFFLFGVFSLSSKQISIVTRNCMNVHDITLFYWMIHTIKL